MSAVKSFYTSFDTDIPKLQKSDHTAAGLEENLPIPENKDIPDVLKVCEPLEKALMLVSVSGGHLQMK